jgi:hypothetical protein
MSFANPLHILVQISLFFACCYGILSLLGSCDEF